ncbi:MAG: peroxiredoxin [Deltaproteobacteria bacterium]|nr:peroxiredoxin [Deltaproteobacteria bacterium]
MIKEGEKAIDFNLPGIDETGVEREYSLKDFKGRALILYFYPKDNTSGCTKEACDLRDNMARLVKSGAAVVGVSPDSLSSHKKFKEKQGLPFPLLSDPEKKVAAIYGAYGEKKMYGKAVKGIIRSTFIIGKDGIVKKAWRSVKVAGHVDQILASFGE